MIPRRLTFAVALALPCAACLSSEGKAPPVQSFYFPTGLALSPAGTRLYVANSDYDLRYTGGSVQALDAERVARLVPTACSSDADCGAGQRCDLEPTLENSGLPSRWCVAAEGPYRGRPCGALGELSARERVLQPGRCGPVELAAPPDGGGSLVLASAQIGAFATSVLLRSRPPGADGTERPGARLFVPVRGDGTLTWFDVEDDSKAASLGVELDCGQAADGTCDDDHRAGDDASSENTLGQRMPREPFGVTATPDGAHLVVTHQTEGAASLFVNDWGEGSALGRGPVLAHVLGGLEVQVIDAAAVPRRPSAPDERFLVTFRNAAQIGLLRLFDDPGASPARPQLSNGGAVAITGNAGGFDSLGLAVDDQLRQRRRAECEALPAEERGRCESAAGEAPLEVYVANRSPSSLLVGATRERGDLPRNFDAIPLSFGPSRVVLGDVIGLDGRPERRVFVVCFDSRALYVYDPQARVIEAVVETGRGPHALAVDSARGLGYLGHFTDSWVGVLDLDRRHRERYGTFVLALGRVTPPRTSK